MYKTARYTGHTALRGVRRAGAQRDDIAIDFMQPRSAASWAGMLAQRRVDAVVNCVGILMPSPGQSFERVHRDGPIELFEGAALAGVMRVVQVSALGAGDADGGAARVASNAAHIRATPYLRTKRAAEVVPCLD